MTTTSLRRATARAAVRRRGDETTNAAAISLTLSNQHARLADGFGANAGSPRNARRHSRCRIGSARQARLRLDLAAQRLANRVGRATSFAHERRLAKGIRGDARRPARRRYRRQRLCDHRLHGSRRFGRRRRIGPAARSASAPRTAAAARLRAQPYWTRSSMGSGSSRVLH